MCFEVQFQSAENQKSARVKWDTRSVYKNVFGNKTALFT